MNILQYPNSIDVADVQVWNNAAFDSDESTSIKASFPSLQTNCSVGSERVEFNSYSSKENYGPALCRSPVCIKSPMPIKPLCPSNFNGHCQGKPLKVLFKQGLLPLPTQDVSDTENEAIRDDTVIDGEMEETQNEIARLSMKLEALRREKVERNSKPIERIRPHVTPKFLEQKQSSKVSFMPKKIEGAPTVSNGMKSNRKGMSMGPSDIIAGFRSQRGKPEITPIPLAKNRRGMSLGPSEIAAAVRAQRGKQEMTPIQRAKGQRGNAMGPSEIFAGVRSQPRGKEEMTPIRPTQQNRRKSCFYKLQGVDEEKVTKDSGGRSLSLSPKSRQAHSIIQASRRRFTTIGSNKSVKKDDRVVSSIQPKNLFKEGEKSVPAKRSIKNGRVVASRYSQIPAQSDLRKMSLPGNDRKRSSSVGKMRVSLPESGCNRVIENKVGMSSVSLPESSEAIRCKSLTHNNPPPVLNITGLLPKIRTIRSLYKSPRDSGPAKKVAELMGKKSFFGEEEMVMEASVCQTLSFDDEEEEE